ncbi:MAG: ComEA family DNA-binding protein [Chloroflexota bacterium]
MSEAIERYRWFIIAAIAAPMLVAIGLLLKGRLDDPAPLTIQTSDLPVGEIQVYVTGAVQHPGVYPLTDGSRWIDGLAAAGGATSDANLTAVNLAKRAQDEDQIVVPSLSGNGGAVAGASIGPLVNLNTASQADLEALPGVGEVRANDIVRSRTTDGPFSQVEDLVLRQLVSQSVFDQIAPMITVN